MKKLAIILVICFITAVFVSSCNQKACPAYAETESQQTGNNG